MQNHSRGFIALISAILIAVSLLVLTVAVGFGGFLGRFAILDSEVKEMSNFLAEACVNTAILKVVQDEDYAGNEYILVGTKRCRVVSVAPVGTTWPKTIKAQASSTGAYTNLEVSVDNTGTIGSWKEVATH